MKAFVLQKQGPIGPDRLKLSDIDKPMAYGHDVLLKVYACGMCGTDVHIAEGEVFSSPKLPLVMGHEVVGVVEEKGDKVESVEVGDRVGVGWTYSSCLGCGKCLTGEENLCSEKESTGYTKDGGYAEYARFDSRFVTKIPENLSFEESAPLFCAGLTAYRSTKKLNPKPYENIAIVGVGGLGAYGIQLVKMYGANVFAFSRNVDHLKLAEKLGADRAVKSGDDLSSDFRKFGIDAAIVFAPSGEVMEKALTGLPRGGRLVMAGNINSTPRMDYRRALAGEKVLTTVSTGSRKDIVDLLTLAAEGKIKSQIEKMKFSDVNRALMKVRDGKVAGRIVLTM